MLTAVLLCAMSQVYSAVSLDPVPSCPTCDALTARVVALEAQLAARSIVEPVRRVRLLEVPQSAATGYHGMPYSPAVRYSSPLGTSLPALAAWAPGSYTIPQATYVSPPASFTGSTVVRRGLFGPRMFSSFSACGPGGCP